MKEYKYYGDLNEDLKKINKKINSKHFFKKMAFQIVGLIAFGSLFYFTGIINNILGFVFGYLGSASTLSIISAREKSKEEAQDTLSKVADLYGDINLNFSNRALSMARMKECIAIQKKQKVIENTETLNVMLSDDEKLVTYFYLLSPEEKIQVLRQIKNDIVDQYDNSVYLLEDEDIQMENIEIPESVIKKLNKTIK